MSHKQDKVWGTTYKLFSNGLFEWHRIVINAGGYCSRHRHQTKSNAFYVEHGHLQVITWNDGSMDTTSLRDGDFITVPAGVLHQFVAVEDTVAFEVYWAEYDPNDIERESVGGMSDVRDFSNSES